MFPDEGPVGRQPPRRQGAIRDLVGAGVHLDLAGRLEAPSDKLVQSLVYVQYLWAAEVFEWDVVYPPCDLVCAALSKLFRTPVRDHLVAVARVLSPGHIEPVGEVGVCRRAGAHSRFEFSFVLTDYSTILGSEFCWQK